MNIHFVKINVLGLEMIKSSPDVASWLGSKVVKMIEITHLAWL